MKRFVMMKKCNIIGFLFLCFFTLQVTGQTLSTGEKTLMDALSDELQRNMDELELDTLGKPFYLDYSYRKSAYFNVSGSLGAIVNSTYIPEQAAGFIKLLFGDYHRTSDRLYDGRGIPVRVPLRLDYDELRRSYWFMTDFAYKNVQYMVLMKEVGSRVNPLSPEREALDDLSKLENPGTLMLEVPKYEFNQAEWEKNIRELSAIFNDYKDVFNSSVYIRGGNTVIYKKTSEGVTLRQPMSFVKLVAKGSVRTMDGRVLEDAYSNFVLQPQDMPSMEVLKKKVKALAESLTQSRALEMMDKYYSGPVLLEYGACAGLFTKNLLYLGGLLAARNPDPSMRDLSVDMGKRILDARISIKNQTALKEYNGTPLFGAYEMDAEGVKPAPEIVLVENGVLRQQLNGRVPTLKTKVSTGSSRFCVSDPQVVYMTAPGVLHIQVENGLKQEKMKKALIKAAKEAGMPCAYIVRAMSDMGALVYRVDLKDGKETKLNGGYVINIDLNKMKAPLEISATESVSNFLWQDQVLMSLIYPSSILLDGIEIKKMQGQPEKGPALTFPLQR